MSKNAITPNALFEFAAGYSRQLNGQSVSMHLPTLREVTQKFRCSMDDVETAIEDYQGPGYMGLVVAFRAGNGGVSEIKQKGSYRVEAYL